MNANICNRTTLTDQVLTSLESRWQADRFNDNVEPVDLTMVILGPLMETCLCAVRIDSMGSTHGLGYLQSTLILVDHHDRAWAVQLCRAQGREADRASTDNRNGATWFDAALQDTYFQACGLIIEMSTRHKYH